MGIVSFSEERCLFVTEVECWRVRFGLVGCDIFDSGGAFVVVVVEEEVNDLELEVCYTFSLSLISIFQIPNSWSDPKQSHFVLQRVTNSLAVTRKRGMVRCSPHAPEFQPKQ